MGAIEILWGVALMATPGLVGWGWILMSENHPNFTAVRLLFVLAPMPLVLMDIWYVLTTRDGFRERGAVSAVLGAIALISLLETLRWVDNKEKPHKESHPHGTD
jgi:hypothetical protein